MLFNSSIFFAFLAIVLFLYYGFLKFRALQTWILLGASYVFYGFWDWRFLALILGSTVVDYLVAQRIQDSVDAKARRRWLWVSMAANLGVLSFFKYFNFFATSATDLLLLLGMQPSPMTLEIILPVGISFYTFQTMSYTIDVYRGKMPATRSFRDFALFVAFFPQLVAGPIERASHFIPQIEAKRKLSLTQLEEAIYLIVYGYFLKVFLADNLGVQVNRIFEDPTKFSGLELGLGVVAFAGQIYGDFAGYSSIARGVARLFGFDLMVNFRLPYFAIDPSDFWRRWHISLSSWLRDYLYISLGGNRAGKVATLRNLVLTMLLGGLWHGAAWNFVIWGLYHGVLLVAYRLIGWPKKGWDEGWRRWPLWALMTIFTLIGWLIFRATSVDQILYFLAHLSLETSPNTMKIAGFLAIYWTPVLVFEWIQHRRRNLWVIFEWPLVVRAVILGLFVAMTIAFGQRDSMEFLYFQF